MWLDADLEHFSMVDIQFSIPLYILCMASTWSTAVCGSPFQVAISETAENFCPTASICGGNGTKTNTKGYVSCCTDCSCEADCEQSRCCFPTSRRDDNTMTERTQCLYASTEQPHEDDQHLFAAYNMIVDTPEQGCAINTDTADSSDTGISWLGYTALQKFHPVYSKSSGKIFKNLQLANCYGEKDILPWNSEIVCELSQTIGLDISVYALYIASPNRYPHCKLNFYYPGDRADIERERCFVNIIDKCANVTFEIPRDTLLTHEEIRSACESGFNSPYALKGHYANVFCHICNGEAFSSQQGCKDPGAKKSDVWSHTWLLRQDVAVGRAKPTENSASGRMACPTTESPEHECRSLFCPTGEIRTRNNGCVWPFIQVGHQAIDLFVDLIPDQLLTVDDIEDILRSDGTEAFQENLINPWPKQWQLKRLTYLPGKNGNAPKAVLYAKLQVYTKYQHDNLLKTISKNIKKKWRLRIGKVDLEFEQRFSAQLPLFLFVSGISEEHYVFIDSNRTQFKIRQKKTIGEDAFERKFPLKITKLFFCEQVALSADEFTTERNNRIIVLNQSRRMFLNGEFGLIEDNMQQISARICLSDSKYVVRTFTSSFEIRGVSPFLACWGMTLYIIFVYYV